MLNVCGKACYVELGKGDVDLGTHVDKEEGIGTIGFKNSDEKESYFPAELRFFNVKDIDKFIKLLNILKKEMKDR